MAFTLTTITVNGNNIGVATSIAGSGGYGEIVGLARASDNTAINPATDDTLQTIANNQTSGNQKVAVQDLTPDAAQTLTAVASGYLEQPGSFSATVTNPGSGTALYAVVAMNANGDTPILQSVSLSTVPGTLSGSAYVTMQWSLVPGATGYKLVKSTNGGSTWVQVGSTTAAGVRSLADTGQATTAYTPATASPALPALSVTGSLSATTSVTYNTTPPTLTTGQTAPLQGDASGNLKVVQQGTVTTSVSSLPALPAGSNAIGSVKLTDGTNTAGVTAAGAQKVDGSATTQPVSGTVTANAGTGFPATSAAGTSAATLLTVQGSASGVAIPVTGSLSATTSVTYNTTAPTLTNGQTAPLQGDTNANLKILVMNSGIGQAVPTNPRLLTTGDQVSSLPLQDATATLTSVASSATSVTLLASNSSRHGAVIVNDSTSTLYVAFAATASATAYTYKLNAGDILEMSPSYTYTGTISGIWSSANGSARCTEL